MRNILASLLLLVIWVAIFPGISWLILSVIENVGSATYDDEESMIGFIVAAVGGLLMLVVSGVVTYFGLRVAVKVVKKATTKATLLIFLGAVFVLSIVVDPILFAAFVPAVIGGWLSKRKIDKQSPPAPEEALTD